MTVKFAVQAALGWPLRGLRGTFGPLLVGLAGLMLLPAAASAFDLQGHRGARGLAPENTMVAFELALRLGVNTLELDVGLTADGVVVVGHDPVLNPALVRDAQGQWLKAPGPAIHTLTWSQLQTYDVGRINPESNYGKTFASQQPADGTRMPRLAEVIDRVKALGADQIRFNIETKLNPDKPDETASPERMAQALLEVIQRAGVLGRVSIQSFDWRTLQVVQRLAPTTPTVYLSIQTANNDNIRDGRWTAGFTLAQHNSVPKMVKAAGGAIWSPNAGALTETLLREAQGMGLKVIPWTVNSPPDMERLISWGVDGLITDYPDRLRTVMQSRGMPLPHAVVSP